MDNKIFGYQSTDKKVIFDNNGVDMSAKASHIDTPAKKALIIKKVLASTSKLNIAVGDIDSLKVETLSVKEAQASALKIIQSVNPHFEKKNKSLSDLLVICRTFGTKVIERAKTNVSETARTFICAASLAAVLLVPNLVKAEEINKSNNFEQITEKYKNEAGERYSIDPKTAKDEKDFANTIMLFNFYESGSNDSFKIFSNLKYFKNISDVETYLKKDNSVLQDMSIKAVAAAKYFYLAGSKDPDIVNLAKQDISKHFDKVFGMLDDSINSVIFTTKNLSGLPQTIANQESRELAFLLLKLATVLDSPPFENTLSVTQQKLLEMIKPVALNFLKKENLTIQEEAYLSIQTDTFLNTFENNGKNPELEKTKEMEHLRSQRFYDKRFKQSSSSETPDISINDKEIQLITPEITELQELSLDKNTAPLEEIQDNEHSLLM